MDVTDFFELQRALQRHREVHTAAEVQGVFVVDEVARNFLDARVLLQQLLDFVRNSVELNQQTVEPLGGKLSLLFAD